MKNSKINILSIIYLLLFILLLLWFLSPSVQPRFSNFSIFLTNLGQIFGLIGLLLFSINLILSTRLPILDKYFHGLASLYFKHSQIGQIAFILLLFHPLLLLSKYASNTNDAASFLWLSNNWPINWGILALGTMIILITLTLYLVPKYHLWKLTHKFMGLAFFFASLHVFLIPSDVSNYLPLRIYILTFLTLGLVSSIYKSLFGRYLVKKIPYTVSQVNQINHSITEIKLKPQSQKLLFSPGQFVFISFINKDLSSESHPFSLTSSPEDKELSFLIKNSGDFTEKLISLSPGTPAQIEGPFGHFILNNSSSKPQVWVAGGIGVTPFISMAKSFPNNLNQSIYLFYCVRNQDEALPLASLINLPHSLKNNFKIINYYSDEQGRISIDKIKKLSGDISSKEFYICAPSPMITSLRQNLILSSVKSEDIHSEEFKL